MDGDNLGYVYISESVGRPDVRNIDTHRTPDVFYVTFDTNLQDFDNENRNHRYYDKSNIWDCIQTEKIQSLLRTGGWFGEFDHPVPTVAGEKLSPERIQNVPPDMRAFKIMDPQMNGNVLTAKIQSAQGARGESFGKEVLAGWEAQFSARAIATMINKMGKPYVLVKRLITYDAPWYPSHKIAHQTSSPKVHSKSFVESAGTALESAKEKINDILVPLKDILTDVGMKDPNVEMICEAFDLPLDNLMGFDNSRKHVLIKDENNVVYANINPDSVKRVNDFFTSF